MFPAALRIIPSHTQTTTISIENGCGLERIRRNTRDFIVKVCKGNSSILTDGNIAELNFTGGLQFTDLQTVNGWNARETPEFPFVLFNFRTPVTITRIVINFILSDRGANEVPIITVFVSNTEPKYPTQSIPVSYDASDAPDTGTYQLILIPTANESFMFWCIDMEPPNGTNWIILSEVELYQEIQTGK